MATMRQGSVVGIFTNRVKAEEAIAALLKAGFTNDQICLYVGKGEPTNTKWGLMASQKNADAMLQDLIGIGVSNDDTGFYRTEFEASHPLVTVTTTKDLDKATAILKDCGGYGPRKERFTETRMAEERPMATASTTTTASTVTNKVVENEAEQHMRLHAEHLQAAKAQKQVGEVVLRKRIVSDKESIDVPVMHEEVIIQRRALAEATDGCDRLDEGEVIRVPVTKEEVNLSKRIVATGDVAIGKRKVGETQHFSDTVSHEEARLEEVGENIPIWDNDTRDQPISPRNA